MSKRVPVLLMTTLSPSDAQRCEVVCVAIANSGGSNGNVIGSIYPTPTTDGNKLCKAMQEGKNNNSSIFSIFPGIISLFCPSCHNSAEPRLFAQRMLVTESKAVRRLQATNSPSTGDLLGDYKGLTGYLLGIYWVLTRGLGGLQGSNWVSTWE